MARIRRALRQASGTQIGSIVRIGDVTIDMERRLVTRGGSPIHLTPKEYVAFTYLIQHAGKVVTHRGLLSTIWGEGYDRELHYLHVLMNQLRRKIEAHPSDPRHILTEPGIGYRLQISD